jgi:hypothetical protein
LRKEVRDLAQFEASAGIYRPETLRSVVDRIEKGDFQTARLGRILTLELLARAVCDCR